MKAARVLLPLSGIQGVSLRSPVFSSLLHSGFEASTFGGFHARRCVDTRQAESRVGEGLDGLQAVLNVYVLIDRRANASLRLMACDGVLHLLRYLSSG